jgi:hypothetical protein
MCRPSAILAIERLVHRFFIGQVNSRPHRPGDPAKRRGTGPINFALVQSLGEEVRD